MNGDIAQLTSRKKRYSMTLSPISSVTSTSTNRFGSVTIYTENATSKTIQALEKLKIILTENGVRNMAYTGAPEEKFVADILHKPEDNVIELHAVGHPYQENYLFHALSVIHNKLDFTHDVPLIRHLNDEFVAAPGEIIEGYIDKADERYAKKSHSEYIANLIQRFKHLYA
jgi:hypothetical protein